MDAVHAVLRRLRHWFLVWFTVEAVAGTAAAAYVLDGLGHNSLGRYAIGSVSLPGTILVGIVVSLFLWLLAWAVLEALLNLRPWARMVMLVIGWITVVSAAINLLTVPGAAALLESVVGLSRDDSRALVVLSALTKSADLAFWSWVIYTLQVNPAVRAAFVRCGALPTGTEST